MLSLNCRDFEIASSIEPPLLPLCRWNRASPAQMSDSLSLLFPGSLVFLASSVMKPSISLAVYMPCSRASSRSGLITSVNS